jgi:hypothetical protein
MRTCVGEELGPHEIIKQQLNGFVNINSSSFLFGGMTSCPLSPPQLKNLLDIGTN